MHTKIAEQKLVTAGTTEYSAPVALGNDNAVMYEVWLINATGLSTPTGLTVSIQGSNDGQQWSTATDSEIFSGDAAPDYAEHDTGEIFPYGQIRLRARAASTSRREDEAGGPGRERAWSDRPSRTSRYGDRGSEDASREMPARFGRSREGGAVRAHSFAASSGGTGRALLNAAVRTYTRNT